MRLSTPRIPPLADDQLDRAQLADLGLNLKSRDDKIGRGLLLNIFRTLLMLQMPSEPFWHMEITSCPRKKIVFRHVCASWLFADWLAL